MVGTDPAARAAEHHSLPDSSVSRWRQQRLKLRDQLAHLLSCQWPPGAEEQSAALGSLCTDLIDYVSTGHFEIYGRVLRSPAAADAGAENLLRHIFHCIGISTDLILGFNDRYDYSLTPLPSNFADELSRLTRSLLLRFALEEQLMALHGRPQGIAITKLRATALSEPG